MTNKAFTLNTFPDTEVDIAPIEGLRAIDAAQQGTTKPRQRMLEKFGQ